MGTPPLRNRTRPPQVLLAVGTVLVVAAGAAALAAPGAATSRGLLLVLALAVGGWSVRAAGAGLRTSEETLATCAVLLAVLGTGALERAAGAGPAALLAAVFLAARLAAPSTRTWLLASWGAVQVAVLHVLPDVPQSLRTEVVLGVALLGLLLTFADGTLVPRVALTTAAPWHVSGVLGGSRTAWTADAGQRWVAVALVAAAGAGLVVARLRPPLDPLLGPPRAVPVVAGLFTGVALAGAAAAYGAPGITTAGYVGLLAATLAPELLSGWPRGLVDPIAVAGGGAAALLAVVQLAAGGHWTSLVVLLLLTSLPSGLVAVARPGERHVALPVAVGCVAGAALLAIPAGAYDAGTGAALVNGVFAAALALDTLVPADRRRGTEQTAAACATAAVAVVAGVGDRAELAAVLALQGGLSLCWAAWTGRGTPGGRRAWPVGAAELVVATWLVVHRWGWQEPEAYTVPLGLGLLLAAGPRLLHGPSWPAWGPGLLVMAVPSAVLAVVGDGTTRPVLVLLCSAAAMLLAPQGKLRAPLLVGAWTAVAVAVGLAALALPWPIAVSLGTGALLLAVGVRREQFPVAGFGVRLADLR